MSLSISTVARTAACAGIVDLLDAGGTIQVRTGSKPATPETAATGTLLCTCTCNAPAFGTPSTGAASLITSPAVNGTAVADGTAGYFRILDSTGTAVADGTITASGGGGDMIVTSTSVVTGGTLTVTSLTVTVPVS